MISDVHLVGDIVSRLIALFWGLLGQIRDGPAHSD